MKAADIEKAIRQAYRCGKNVGRQGDLVKVEGMSNGLKVRMYVNTGTKTIESAFPVR
jgi:hypothetical protein